MAHRTTSDLMAVTVLALLREAPCHPYRMRQLIRDRHKTFADGSPRLLYHAVDRLVARGLVEAAEVSHEGRRPERTVYRITASGRAELESRLGEMLEEVDTGHDAFAVALSFAPVLTPAEVAEALRQRIAHLDHLIPLTEGLIDMLQTRLHLPRAVLLDNEYQLMRARAERIWLTQLAGELRDQGDRWPDLEAYTRFCSTDPLATTAETTAGSDAPDKETHG